MSSKRGRKRNDNLPPNRARDVQRAFRARRAAHLVAMEERVAELTEENDLLRARLNMAPASRPPLGKGPTGKDRPRGYSPRSGEISYGDNGAPISRATSSASSTRGNSISPSASNGLQPSPPMAESSQWPDMIAEEGDEPNGNGGPGPSPSTTSFSPTSAVSAAFSQQAQAATSFASPVSPSFAQGSGPSGAFPPSTSSTAFSLGSISAPVAQKAQQQQQQQQQQQYSYSPHLPPASRPTLAGTVYMQPLPGQNYSQNGFLDGAGSYQASPISPHDAGHMHHHHPSGSSLQSLVHPQSNAPFNTRRSITEPNPYRSLGNHHGYMTAAQAGAQRGGSGDSRLNPVQ